MERNTQDLFLAMTWARAIFVPVRYVWRIRRISKFAPLLAIFLFFSVFYIILWNSREATNGDSRNRSEWDINREPYAENDEVGKHGEGVIEEPDQNDIHSTEVVRVGPGEMGKAVNISRNQLGDADRKLYDEGFNRTSFSQYTSDLISVKRTLPDMRPELCKGEKYLENLPDTSVIVCFHNEAWSTLLRSVHSVLNRTPAKLLKQVILVDDASDQDHLKASLDYYFAKYSKVKILRAKQRIGLVQARLLGYRHSTGTVLTFLDSHIECTKGWVEPLLDRIARDRRNVVWPVINVIDTGTFQYNNMPINDLNVGGFNWNLQFTWHKIPERIRKTQNNAASPVPSPTMAGGLFSIDRTYFEELGTYDEGINIWGGENLEISFKTWMCGGTLELVPCSRVGHIFRNKSPYIRPSDSATLKINLVRVAEVWMDDYKQLYYQIIGNGSIDFGDISSRQKLRKNLKCKSFEWYLTNIYPEQFLPHESLAWGEIRNNLDSEKYCMDVIQGPNSNGSVDIYPCHGQGGNQLFHYSAENEIRKDDLCVEVEGPTGRIKLFACHGLRGNQLWTHHREATLLVNPWSKKCLQLELENMTVSLANCNEANVKQRWKFQNYASDVEYPWKPEKSSFD